MDFIKKLPGLGDLPDWLKGTGKWVIGNVTDWIKKTVSGLVSGSDSPGGNIKGSIAKAIEFAATLGFPRPSGPGQLFRPGDPGFHGSGRAADFGDAGRTQQQMANLFFGLYAKFGKSINELFYDRMPWYIDAHDKKFGQFGGHDDHIHVAFAKGGVYGGDGPPFVGSYRNGGVVPADGYGYLHRGETVIPREGGGPMVNVEHMEIRSDMDLERFSRSLGWQLAAGGA
jgi:hypothetical protein